MKIGLREAVFALLLTAIPAGAWWFIFRPNGEQTAKMLEQIEIKREKLKKLNRATGTIGDLRKEIAVLGQEIEFLRSRLPSQKEIELPEIWNLAKANQLQAMSVRPLKKDHRLALTRAGGQYAEQPVEVELEGDFLGFYTFLQALENRPRVMRVRMMELNRPQSGPEGHIKATFIMSIFFEKAERGTS